MQIQHPVCIQPDADPLSPTQVPSPPFSPFTSPRSLAHTSANILANQRRADEGTLSCVKLEHDEGKDRAVRATGKHQRTASLGDESRKRPRVSEVIDLTISDSEDEDEENVPPAASTSRVQSRPGTSSPTSIAPTDATTPRDPFSSTPRLGSPAPHELSDTAKGKQRDAGEQPDEERSLEEEEDEDEDEDEEDARAVEQALGVSVSNLSLREALTPLSRTNDPAVPHPTPPTDSPTDGRLSLLRHKRTSFKLKKLSWRVPPPPPPLPMTPVPHYFVLRPPVAHSPTFKFPPPQSRETTPLGTPNAPDNAPSSPRRLGPTRSVTILSSAPAVPSALRNSSRAASSEGHDSDTEEEDEDDWWDGVDLSPLERRHTPRNEINLRKNEWKASAHPRLSIVSGYTREAGYPMGPVWLSKRVKYEGELLPNPWGPPTTERGRKRMEASAPNVLPGSTGFDSLKARHPSEEDDT
ncbi:Cytidylyltransferase [Pseudohyphozyma bogoriensis]|nr:Cytidylyltransferase [Pseudohyphozyma bogoriensis]